MAPQRTPRSTRTTPTVVVVHAHPDDEAIFTGATIATLTAQGARVVLVTATSGEEGVPRVALRPGETMRDRRVAELETACDLLGVARLHLLDYRDSGAHAGPYRRGSLGATAAGEVARRVGAVVAAEGADAVVHYDRRGIYGHVDHVQVHRAGALAARRHAVAAYEATVDAVALRQGPRHVLQQAAGEELDAGVPAQRIGLTVTASQAALEAKYAAMSAHASQIGPEYLDADAFAAAYRTEWFLRTAGAPVLEPFLTPAPALPGAWAR